MGEGLRRGLMGEEWGWDVGGEGWGGVTQHIIESAGNIYIYIFPHTSVRFFFWYKEVSLQHRHFWREEGGGKKYWSSWQYKKHTIRESLSRAHSVRGQPRERKSEKGQVKSNWLDLALVSFTFFFFFFFFCITPTQRKWIHTQSKHMVKTHTYAHRLLLTNAHEI